jgi:hypothetical protein
MMHHDLWRSFDPFHSSQIGLVLQGWLITEGWSCQCSQCGHGNVLIVYIHIYIHSRAGYSLSNTLIARNARLEFFWGCSCKVAFLAVCSFSCLFEDNACVCPALSTCSIAASCDDEASCIVCLDHITHTVIGEIYQIGTVSFIYTCMAAP